VLLGGKDYWCLATSSGKPGFQALNLTRTWLLLLLKRARSEGIRWLYLFITPFCEVCCSR